MHTQIPTEQFDSAHREKVDRRVDSWYRLIDDSSMLSMTALVALLFQRYYFFPLTLVHGKSQHNFSFNRHYAKDFRVR